MHVEPNHKFAACFLSRCYVAVDVEETTIDSVLVGRRLNPDMGPHWPAWLGTIATDEIREDGLLLYVTAPARHPTVLDAENETLVRQRDDLLNGLLVQGVPSFMRGFLMTGANVDGEIQIRQYGTLDHVEPTYEAEEFRVGRGEIARAVRLGRRLRQLQDAQGQRWVRLLGGLRVLLKANRESNSHGERLHQFVRALEALVKPRVMRSRRDFADRVQTFVVAGSGTRDTLLQMFDLRSQVEHLHSPLDILTGTKAQRIALANRRTRQADALARFALCRVLEEEALHRVFATDDGIDAFWQMPHHKRVATWLQRIDIDAVG